MITELNFAKLTPASFAMANANDVDVGVGRSMLLNNIRHGREVDHIMTGLDPEYLPDWAALKPQYEALEHGGVTSAVNVWHRVERESPQLRRHGEAGGERRRSRPHLWPGPRGVGKGAGGP